MTSEDYGTRKHLENMDYFNCLGSVITNDARRTRETESSIVMAKAAFNNKKTLFTSKLDSNLRKKLMKCYIWSIALYGAETWTVRKVDQKHLESFEIWCLEKDGEDQFDRSFEK